MSDASLSAGAVAATMTSAGAKTSSAPFISHPPTRSPGKTPPTRAHRVERATALDQALDFVIFSDTYAEQFAHQRANFAALSAATKRKQPLRATRNGPRATTTASGQQCWWWKSEAQKVEAGAERPWGDQFAEELSTKAAFPPAEFSNSSIRRSHIFESVSSR
ncbi:hypothetical protein [Rhodopseudomonas palustris]|uniref:Uncharacterized protein n=1 Tax=Rhodopseudomonas palustris (strain ATCC BAA-98 / CGA009) TaxID=258594 RepID=A0AAE9XUF9_RHOPA|nr:hypothetical protein [Rhodopseudomonas palustris]WAB80241.1 hypothetical protein OR798_03310 [Rhodopseudomonas palustris]WCL90770.1 hypothetical protein TX73_003310 [Rhodopseudomonas palustris CGA009]WND54134.1 hypothetical protein L1A21_03310 [Rhodopseudomonas palustris]